MNSASVEGILARMEADLAALRKTLIKPTLNGSKAAIPVLKDRYSRKEAELAKLEIDAAFDAGLITYDKRRGMKMVVTKSTNGWSPG